MCPWSSPDDSGYAGAVQKHFGKLVDNLRCLLSIKPDPSTTPRYELEILLLGCCYIDSLAGVFLDAEKSRARFRELLWDYSDRSKLDFRRVDLPALRKALERYPIATKHNGKWVPRDNHLPLDVTKLTAVLEQEIQKCSYNAGDIRDIDEPTFDQVLPTLMSLLTTEQQAEHGNKIEELIKEATYAGVLYEQYRSPLVHETLIRGHWYGAATDLPVYVASEGGDVDLTFPPLFVVSVLENILETIFSKYWVTTE